MGCETCSQLFFWRVLQICTPVPSIRNITKLLFYRIFHHILPLRGKNHHNSLRLVCRCNAPPFGDTLPCPRTRRIIVSRGRGLPELAPLKAWLSPTRQTQKRQRASSDRRPHRGPRPADDSGSTACGLIWDLFEPIPGSLAVRADRSSLDAALSLQACCTTAACQRR